MKTIAMMTLLVGTIAVGVAPAAEARSDRSRDAAQEHIRDAGHRHGARDARRHAPPARTRRDSELRRLANRLERATDELRADARHAVGRVNRYEAQALRAIHRLEVAADRFSRRAQRRRALGTRELHRELRKVEAAFQTARSRADAFRRSGELRRDFRRVSRLIDELEESFEPRRHRAGHRRGYRVAQR